MVSLKCPKGKLYRFKSPVNVKTIKILKIKIKRVLLGRSEISWRFEASSGK
jgi:hypothetical protein